MSVDTDIRTGLPINRGAGSEDGFKREIGRLKAAAAAAGIGETPQAEALRQMVADEMVRRIEALIKSDEVLQAMTGLLRRMKLKELQAEDAVRELMARASRDPRYSDVTA